ncbi:MAG: RNA polymerase factor sigma-54 [Phocaeicola sp.]|uniref:RNA polymerase factor sigma-54 n=1 Tax=Phocaeicola sp. TaxID=2773926 RepID=UPI003F9ED706
MPQKSTQIQTQSIQQVQTLSPQQIMVVKLLELPKQEFEERIQTEILDNPALETVDKAVEGGSDDYEMEEYGEKEDRQGDEEGFLGNDDDSPSDYSDNDSLSDYRTEDDIPDYKLQEQNRNRGEVAEEIPFSDITSFYDELKDQLMMQNLTEKERGIGEYLIGSLDDDGLLRKSLSSVADELAIYQGVNANEDELRKILKVIQSFDPAGIGARDLQECLLLQIRRKPDSPLKKIEQDIITRCLDDFMKKNKDRIIQRLNITEETYQEALTELTKLNPRPGSSLGEAIGKNFQQIIPDFIIDADDDGNVTVSLNNWNVPELRLSREFSQMLDEQIRNKDNQSKSQKDAFLFLKQKVDAAQGFINAVKQRQHTLIVTMNAIVNIQKAFFQTGDESLLKPMILKDVAERAHLDISTVSRVSNSKYAQTNFGIYPLKFFFIAGFKKNDDDDEILSSHEIKRILRECVDEEDKNSPLTDDELASLLKKKGYPIARRTVAKYRLQLNIPTARLRRE